MAWLQCELEEAGLQADMTHVLVKCDSPASTACAKKCSLLSPVLPPDGSVQADHLARTARSRAKPSVCVFMCVSGLLACMLVYYI